MANIRIERAHTLGLAQARKVANTWARQASTKYDMECSYAEGGGESESGAVRGKNEGDITDLLSFSRSGVSGTLAVTATRFELNAKLGFLLGAFKEKIEEAIESNLDKLIASQPGGHADVPVNTDSKA